MNRPASANSAVGVVTAPNAASTGRTGLSAQLRALLREHGVLSSIELQRLTGKSQATISRALAKLSPDVVTIGRARAARYALPKTIMGWPGAVRIVHIDAAARGSQWGWLYFLEGDRLHVTTCEGAVCSDTRGELPWFLSQLRPQGFLGRLRGQSLGFADSNPENWTIEQVLFAVIAFEKDHPGALSLTWPEGEIRPAAPADIAERLLLYDDIARDVSKTLPAGSSAGGEQPKFITHFNGPESYERLIVKFSPPRGTPFGERWHDLLHTERIALDVLRSYGVAAAESRLVSSAARTYLESVRFDRIGQFGKRHVVPLSAVHRAFVAGAQQHWAATADALAEQGRLPHADARQIRVLREFGRLIGNTDMHFGNLGLWVENMDDGMAGARAPRFRLAPVYDMLCMTWRPGEFRDDMGYTPFDTPCASPGAIDAWQQAATIAAAFWQTLTECADASGAIRRAADTQHQRLLKQTALAVAAK